MNPNSYDLVICGETVRIPQNVDCRNIKLAVELIAKTLPGVSVKAYRNGCQVAEMALAVTAPPINAQMKLGYF